MKLFLSLDMNVLPSRTTEDAQNLLDKVTSLVVGPGQLQWGGGVFLSTFGGHDAVLGDLGWEGWLKKLEERISKPVRRPSVVFLKLICSDILHACIFHPAK
jgi:hypothetical protein